MDTEKLKTRFAPSPTGLLHIGHARTAIFAYCLARQSGGEFVLRIEDTDRERHIEEAIPRLIEDLHWLGLEWDEGVDLRDAGVSRSTGVSPMQTQPAEEPFAPPHDPHGRDARETHGQDARATLCQRGPNGPYRQSERLAIYAEHIRKLIDSGVAYYCFDTEAEEKVLRAKAEAAKTPFRYPRPAVFPTHADADAARAAGRPVVVRFACPAQDVTIHDDAFGDVTMPAAEMDDFVLLKADGFPTYHPANVIDDALMGVNYIVRGQDFLGQTWRHVLLRRAWGFPEPKGYCHLPLILNPDNSKMSKRDKHRLTRQAAKEAIAKGTSAADLAASGAVGETEFSAWIDGTDAVVPLAKLERLAAMLKVHLPEIDVTDFRKSGYLPEAIVNFVALLGWNPGQDREKFTLTELTELFSPTRIGKTNARFDRAKLLAFNTDYLAAADEPRRLAALKDFLQFRPGSPIPAGDDTLLAALLRATPTLRTMDDLPAKCDVLFVADDAYAFDESAVEKNLRKGNHAGFDVLAQLEALLAAIPEAAWQLGPLHDTVEKFAADNALGMGKVAQPLRVAVTGNTVSPPIADTLVILGKDKTLARIRRCQALR